MAYNNIYENSGQFDYPTYPFPVEYTKSGQQELKNKFESAEHSEKIQTQNISTYNDNASVQTTSAPAFNLTTLLPIIKAMNSKGKLSTSDMMKTLMPLLNKNSQNMGELIAAFDGLNKQERHTSKIESYTRIDSEE
ncbi:MAG: hypothetical protein IK070_02635 [Clostridia bacterium]|nr:hypothetical protein [Clostridia bacterium]